MKLYSSIATIVLSALLLNAPGAPAQKSSGKGAGRGQGSGRGEGRGGEKSKGTVEQTVAATPTVNITLTTRAGDISVRGWDRPEVHAELTEPEPGSKLELRKTCNPVNASDPASQVEVIVSNKPEDDPDYDGSDADIPISLDVPRGATLFLKTQDGDIEVEGIAEAHIETSGGKIEMRHVAKGVEATTLGGDVSLESSSGRARLTSFGGSIEVSDFRPVDPNDFLKAKTTSGDIVLEQVTHARVEATTITGELKMEGALTRGGNYAFTTTTGDVTLVLPVSSSFKLTARVSEGGEIVTEFPLKYSGPPSPLPMMQAGRLTGTYGTGDASINLISFSGTLRLRKE